MTDATAAPNLPAKADTSGTVALPDEWSALAQFDDGFDAFVEHFGLTMPRLRTDFGRNGRGFVDDLTGEVFRELRGIIVAAPPARAWWAKKLDEGGKVGPPECASRVNFRLRVPDEGVPLQQSPQCTDARGNPVCPHAAWGEKDDGSPDRPACQESVNLLMHEVDQDRMFWVRVAGTGIRPYQNFVSYLRSKKQLPFMVVTHVTLEDRHEGAFDWLVPQFMPVETLTPETVAPYREVAERAMQSWTSVADEMAGAAATGDVATPGAKTYTPGPDEEPF